MVKDSMLDEKKQVKKWLRWQKDDSLWQWLDERKAHIGEFTPEHREFYERERPEPPDGESPWEQEWRREAECGPDPDEVEQKTQPEPDATDAQKTDPKECPLKDKPELCKIFSKEGAEECKTCPNYVKSEAKPAGENAQKKTPKAKKIAELNETCAVVKLGGGTYVLDESDPKKVEFMHVRDFREFISNQWVEVRNKKGDTETKQIAQLWLDSPQRRTFKKVEFDPKKPVNSNGGKVYNLWRGFAVEPKKGKWDLFENHMVENICGGDTDYYVYLLTWMARIVQQPGGEKPGVAVVLRGGKGVGKGVFANQFGKLFGGHYKPLAHKKHITGNFNHHLKDALVVFWDEVPGGNSDVANILNHLITEPTHIVEPKGKDAFTVANHMNFILASNEGEFIPATSDERRYFMLDVGDNCKQDHAYFGAIVDQMKNGGREALLYDLLQWSLNAANLRKAPKTRALYDQIAENMDDVEKWWEHVLATGINGQYTEGAKWYASVCKDQLFERYGAFSYSKRSKGGFFQRLKNIVRLGDGRESDGKRRRYKIFRTLEEHRKEFRETYGMEPAVRTKPGRK